VLQKLDGPAAVLVLEAVGRLEKGDWRRAIGEGRLEMKDYESVLVPGIEHQFEATGELRVVFVLGAEFESLTVGAAAADAGLFLGELVHHELSKWKSCAIVTTHERLR
jgi:hypothetical protein